MLRNSGGAISDEATTPLPNVFSLIRGNSRAGSRNTRINANTKYIFLNLCRLVANRSFAVPQHYRVALEVVRNPQFHSIEFWENSLNNLDMQPARISATPHLPAALRALAGITLFFKYLVEFWENSLNNLDMHPCKAVTTPRMHIYETMINTPYETS